MRIKNHFHINGFALSLALKERLEATQKWSILGLQPRDKVAMLVNKTIQKKIKKFSS